MFGNIQNIGSAVLNFILVITEQNRKIEECLNSIAKFQGRIDGVQEGRSNLETESVKSLTLVQSKIEKEKRILESLNSRISDQTGEPSGNIYGFSDLF